MKKTYFISGHRDITKEEFEKWYIPKLQKAIMNCESNFVVGDCIGVDSMAQDWLNENIDNLQRVTVYHMFTEPRYISTLCFKTSGGYKSDVSRDTAMTIASDEDIAFIRKGRWTSGTAQNILRRYEK